MWLLIWGHINIYKMFFRRIPMAFLGGGNVLWDYLFITADSHWGCCKAARWFVKFTVHRFFCWRPAFWIRLLVPFPLTVTLSLSCLMEKTAKSVVSAQIFSSLAHSTIITRDNMQKFKWNHPFLAKSTHLSKYTRSQVECLMSMAQIINLFKSFYVKRPGFAHMWSCSSKITVLSTRRSGAGQVWQQDRDIWGAHQGGTQHVALPILYSARES